MSVEDGRAAARTGWHFIADGEIRFRDGALVYALNRYGDIFGPLPVEMFHPDAWAGNMLHASHDLVAVAPCDLPWRDAFGSDVEAVKSRGDVPTSDRAHDTAASAQNPEPPPSLSPDRT